MKNQFTTWNLFFSLDTQIGTVSKFVPSYPRSET